MERVEGARVVHTLFWSQPIYVAQTSDAGVFPRYIVKGREREGRPRHRIGSSSKDVLDYYCSQPDFTRGTRRSIPHRSLSDVRLLDNQTRARPVLIRQNRPNMDGVDQNGTDAVLIGRDGTLHTPAIRGDRQLPRMPVRRSASAGPQFERVKEWLSGNDFTHDMEEMPKSALGVHEEVDKQRDGQRNMISDAVTSPIANSPKPSVPSPPPPPPPLPVSSTTPKILDKIDKPKLHPDLDFSKLTHKIISPDTAVAPKLLFSSEMAAARRNSSNAQDRQRKQSVAESYKSGTTPSEKHYERFVDSIFAKALGSEIDSYDTSTLGRHFNSDYQEITNHWVGTSSHAGFINPDGADALMSELKDKLKIKKLTGDQLNEQSACSVVTHDNLKQNKVREDNFHSDIISREFTPLATSTPPPPAVTSGPHPLSSPVSQLTGNLAFPPPSTLSTSQTERKKVTYSDIPRTNDDDLPNESLTRYNTEHHNVSALRSHEVKPYSLENTQSKQSPHHQSPLDWSQSSTTKVEHTTVKDTHNSNGGGTVFLSSPTSSPLNQTKFVLHGHNFDRTKNGLITPLLSQREKSQIWNSSDSARTNSEPNTATDVQTGQEFFYHSNNGAQFEPSRHNRDAGGWFVLSSEIPEQRHEGLHKDLHIENSLLHNGDGVSSLKCPDTQTSEAGGTLPGPSQNNKPNPGNSSLYNNIKTNGGQEVALNSTDGNLATSVTSRPVEPRDLVTRPTGWYSEFNHQAPSVNHGRNLYPDDECFEEDYPTPTSDPNVPADCRTDTRCVYEGALASRPLAVEAGLPTSNTQTLFALSNRHAHQRVASVQQLNYHTHLQDYHVTTGDSSEPLAREEFPREGRLNYDPAQNRFSVDEDVTAFRGDNVSRARVTCVSHNDSGLFTDGRIADTDPPSDYEASLENVKPNVSYSNQECNSYLPGKHHQVHDIQVDRFVQKSALKNYESGCNVVRFATTVSDRPLRKSQTFNGDVLSQDHRAHFTAISKSGDYIDDDSTGWTSSSSSDSDTNLQRFASGAISQKAFNSLFAHGATVSLRDRADRTLTGSHHNLLAAWPPNHDDDIDNNPFGQTRSAPTSSRKKKKDGRSLSIKKVLGRSFFDAHRTSHPGSESTEPITGHTESINGHTESKNSRKISFKDNDSDGFSSDNEGPASPTTISITSSNHGPKVVKIFHTTDQDKYTPPEDYTTTNISTMLSNHNHDHEMLPPSASINRGKNNPYASNSLLRSKSMFTSTPSLFTRSSPEEKFWKKEMKREKEEKKRMEEERKRLEKLEKKEHRQRVKSEKKSATLNARNIPRDWNHVTGPVEKIYMRPGLRMSAVPTDYVDDHRTHSPHQLPRVTGHYAVPNIAVRGGVYANGASAVDMTRVEQVYGTTQRRPLPAQSHSHYSTPYGYLPPREHQPRVILLHRSPEGYGFVLRGAKSKLPTGGGFNDFTPTADYPALQYLDSVDPGSQADRAGLKAGDFILEINGENVVRSSHEHVVHLIRSSSDVLTLKVVTVTQADSAPGDWYAFQEYGAMTLPTRKKSAAPLPPHRDPQTSLSFSRASSKSMTEGLAEIEKLDAAIAEFDGHEEAQKVASVRASHALKRVSVMDYEGLITGEPTATANGNKVGKGHVSPAEARIMKYHKRSPSQTIERSKSTPDISAAIDQEYNDRSAGGQLTGSWTKNRAPPPPNPDYHYGTGSNGRKTGTHDSSHRIPADYQVTPSVPPTPEIVRIHTTGKNSNYGNISAEIENRKKMESPYESSFRPESNSVINNKNNFSNQNGDKYISFADERIMENANKFIQKYPNATVLVTADIHTDKTDGIKDRVLYEPDPDYDESDDDKSIFYKNNSSVVVANSKLNRDTNGLRSVVHDSSGAVKQNKSSVTVISITNDANKDSTKHQGSPHLTSITKSSPMSIHIQENTSLTSPVQSISSSRRSSGVVMATPSQPSSAGSSRRSSIQSNYSGENVDRNGKSYAPTSITVGNSRDNHHADVPPPPPPPPPLGTLGRSSSRDSSTNSTLRTRPNDVEAIAVLQNRVSTDDILAAVADRRNRLETEGPRLSDVKSLPTSKSTHELNQEALKAAVAKRKSRIDQNEDQSVVDEIEARLNRNKKLQAAKFLGSDVSRNSDAIKKDDETPAPPSPVVAPSTPKPKEDVGSSLVKSKDITQLEQTNKPVSQVKLSPVVAVKSSQHSSLSEVQKSPAGSSEPSKNVGVDFRSVLKPVDVKGKQSPLAVQSKPAAPASPEVSKLVTPGTNITTIVMSKGNSSKVQAPPPPPPPPVLPTVSSSAAKPKPVLPALASSKTGQNPGETKPALTNPLSPTTGSVSTSPSTNNIPSSADYIALAERARQEYLKKKASGNLQANIEKKGPVEITPNRKLSQRNKPTTPTSPAAPLTPSSKSQIEIKPNLETKEDNVQVSVQDRIKILQTQKGLTNGKTNVAGVTEDHSHTETSLSNGTIKKAPANSKVLASLNMMPSSRIAPPPPGFGDTDGNSTSRGVDIIPPPSSFSVADSPDSALSVPSYRGQTKENIKDLIAHSPPPPPDFGNSSLGDQDAFIPPPPEFLEIDSNANESKAVDKNSRPFASKPVSDWSCMDVLDWLDSLNLPQYRISFAKAHVDGMKLVNMGRNEFINLGVAQVAHRMNLERSVKKLNMGISTNL